MKLRKYFLTMAMGLAALMFAPVYAQDEPVEEPTVADEEVVTDDDAEDEGKGKKKKKKSKKKSKADKGQDKGDKAKKDAKAEVAAVPAALAKFKQINGKPNLKADYYIYMYSASWCGYCKQCMPVAVDAYKKMKSSRKVEMIVIGGDKSEKEAKNYMKSCKAKMPSIMFSALQATQFRGLPGCGMPGFPAIAVVDKDGNQITSAVGASQVQEILKNWKGHTIGR